MTDYRLVMGLLVQGYAYRQIEAMAGCAHRAIARARRVLDEEGFTTRVSVFVSSLPFSGMVFAHGCVDEKQPAWLDAHRRSFEYFGGVTQVVIPDYASTASNQISRTEKARDVNSAMRSSWSTTPPQPSRPAHTGPATRGMSKPG